LNESAQRPGAVQCDVGEPAFSMEGEGILPQKTQRSQTVKY
jgi:hypothetical protein